MTESDFVHVVASKGGDEPAARLVWRYLSDWGYEHGFTPYPDDNLTSVFGLAEEELDEDLILRALTDLNVPIPGTSFVEQFGPVDSPLRVAQFVAACRSNAERPNQA